MARIARSDKPLYQTVARPVSWSVTLKNPDGSAINLTGATVHASLVWSGTKIDLLTTLSSSSQGLIVITGVASLMQDLPIGRIAELQLTVTDSQGAMTDYVWPVVGETP